MLPQCSQLRLRVTVLRSLLLLLLCECCVVVVVMRRRLGKVAWRTLSARRMQVTWRMQVTRLLLLLLLKGRAQVLLDSAALRIPCLLLLQLQGGAQVLRLLLLLFLHCGAKVLRLLRLLLLQG